MSEPEDQAVNVLKQHAGIIHRQPVFDRALRVHSYYLSFLNDQGQPLTSDHSVPEMAEQLPEALIRLFGDTALLLNIPPHWQAALSQSTTLDANVILPASQQTGQTHKGCYQQITTTADSDTGCHTLLVDLQQVTDADLNQLLTDATAKHQSVCAVNVNNADDYQRCINQHIPQLSGEFYTRPRPPQANKTHPSQQQLLQLLVKLHDPDADAESLAQIINQDVTLSYKLLKLVNSAFFGLPREISNTRQAIVMLGQNKIKTWASLLCLSGVDDKPSELRRIAMQRARMCELLARHYKGQSESFFICGLLSTLDALLDKPLTDIIEGLPLHPDIVAALIDHAGPAGAALRDTMAYERAQWTALTQSSISLSVLVSTYLDAVLWTSELDQQLQD